MTNKSEEVILITGAGGCIGAWVVKHLLDAGAKPVAFDLSEDRRRLALLCDNKTDADTVTWETGDIGDYARVAAVVEKHRPSAIIHLAALQVPFCRADPVRGANVNVVGTVNVFEAARQYGIRRITYASSVAASAMGRESQWLETLYGAYKICNEQTARVYWRDIGVSSVGIRPTVVYGPARDQGMSAKPTLAMLAAAAGLPYVVPFTGMVGFVYAAEAAAAFIQAVGADRNGAEVFDLNGTPHTVEEVVGMILARLPQAQVRCEGAALPFPADMSDAPLRAYIGDYAHFEFADGLAATLDLFSRRLAEGRLHAKQMLER